MLNTNEYIARTQRIEDMSQAALLDDCLKEGNDAEHLWLDTLITLIDERSLSTDEEFIVAFNVAINDLTDSHKKLLRNKAMKERQEYLDAVEQRDKAYEHPAKSASDSIDRDNAKSLNGYMNFTVRTPRSLG